MLMNIFLSRLLNVTYIDSYLYKELPCNGTGLLLQNSASHLPGEYNLNNLLSFVLLFPNHCIPEGANL